VTEVERTVGEIITIVQKTVPLMLSATPVKVVSAQHPLTRAATVEKVCGYSLQVVCNDALSDRLNCSSHLLYDTLTILI